MKNRRQLAHMIATALVMCLGKATNANAQKKEPGITVDMENTPGWSVGIRMTIDETVNSAFELNYKGKTWRWTPDELVAALGDPVETKDDPK